MKSGYYETKPTYTKEYKKECWDMAIGLQAVDGLEVSPYLKELSAAEIDGKLTLDEIEELLYKKYGDKNSISLRNEKREADIVSKRIVDLLRDPSFTFSPVTLNYIHKTLFEGIYDFAGAFRNYNISKSEPILGGRSVVYTNYSIIKETFAYDFTEEKIKSYEGLSKAQIVDRLTKFTSAIWQVHAFGEGNTRTTAIFMEKYLNTMGFKVDNSLFEKYSQYFRNALVRSNFSDYQNNVSSDMRFLKKFYENLLFEGKNLLRNRDLIVPEYISEIKESIDLDNNNELENAILSGDDERIQEAIKKESDTFSESNLGTDINAIKDEPDPVL